MHSMTIRTRERNEFHEITYQVRDALAALGADRGVLHLSIPHTTAGLTMNENADPNVRHDMLTDLERLVPAKQPHHRHAEGNSAAHLKASLMGSHLTVLVEEGRLVLGRWQGIYLCEFDGPRVRQVHLQFVAA
jgi:secondary thiamine-phosphate synthase enzyme